MASLSAERGWTVVLPRTPFTVPESLDPNIVRRRFGPLGIARRTRSRRDRHRDQPDERALTRPATAQELATRLNAEVIGDPSRTIVGPAAPEHATSEDVVAVSGTAWLAVAKASSAGTVVLRTQDLEAYGDAENKTLILSMMPPSADS